MKCPLCNCATHTIETRAAQRYVRRRHKCPACEHRFTTREFYEEDTQLAKRILKYFRQCFPEISAEKLPETTPFEEARQSSET